MVRKVDGPEITGQVTHKQTGQAYGPVTVTVTPKVYTDPEMTASVTSLTTDGTGVFSCYAPPGNYTFTTTAIDAQTIEPVEVLGREGGTGGVGTAASSVPVGGALGQALVKKSATPYDLTWRTIDEMLDVRDRGALLDGATDDGPALQQAFNDAVTANGGTILVPNTGILQLGGAQVSGTVTGAAEGGGNYPYSGQILAPAVPYTAGQKVVKFKGTVPAPLGLWAYVTGDNAPVEPGGSIIRSNATSGKIFDCIPHATVSGAGVYFTNVIVEIEDLLWRAPNNPACTGLDLRKAVGATVRGSAVTVNAGALSITAPSNGTFGLRLPENGNGSLSVFELSQIYGFDTGLTHSEWANLRRAFIGQCNVGIAPGAGSHVAFYDHLTLQWNKYHWSPTANCFVSGRALGLESKGSAPTFQVAFYDPSNFGRGAMEYLNYTSSGLSSANTVGCTNLDLKRLDTFVSSKFTGTPGTPQTLATSATFSHSDNIYALPQADSGQLWTTPNGGVFGISSNKGYRVSGSRQIAIVAPHKTGTFSVSVDITLGASNPVAGLVFHATDTSNYMAVGLENDATPNTLFFQKYTAGVQANYQTAGAVTLVNGSTYTLRVDVTPTTIAAFVGGVQVGATYTKTGGEQTTFNPVPYAGLLAYDSNCRFDNFSLT